MPADWSDHEVELVVADYMAMLDLELRGRPYTKSARNEALRRHLNGRSKGSVEFKHQNISAVLVDLGAPYIDGYKPMANYQAALVPVVMRHLGILPPPELHAPSTARDLPPDPDALRRILVRAPTLTPPIATDGSSARPAMPVRIDWVAREQHNRALGLDGEHFVLAFERARLQAQGRPDLAPAVEHVAQTQGDGLGYDIQSFDLDGRPRHIEVKTTASGIQTPYWVTRNELAVSHEMADTFHVYRVFAFRQRPRLFTLPGPIDGHSELRPESWRALPR